MATRRLLALAGALAVLMAGLGACSDDEGSTEELCEAVRGNTSVASLFDGGFDPTDTTAALDQLRSARVTLGELRDAAPGEVRGALAIEIAYIEALLDGLEQADEGEPAAIVRTVQRITDDHPEVPEAADELAAFTQEECGA
jgi:hypothetical protein